MNVALRKRRMTRERLLAADVVRLRGILGRPVECACAGVEIELRDVPDIGAAGAVVITERST